MSKKTLIIISLLCYFGNTFSMQEKLDEFAIFLENIDNPVISKNKSFERYADELLSPLYPNKDGENNDAISHALSVLQKENNKIRESIPLTYEDVEELNEEMARFEKEYCGFTEPLSVPIDNYMVSVRDFKNALNEYKKNNILDETSTINTFFVNPNTGEKIYTVSKEAVDNRLGVYSNNGDTYSDDETTNIKYDENNVQPLTYIDILTNANDNWLMKIAKDNEILKSNEFKNLKIAFGGYVNTNFTYNNLMRFLPSSPMYDDTKRILQLVAYDKYSALAILAHERGHAYDHAYRRTYDDGYFKTIVCSFKECNSYTYLAGGHMSEIVAMLFEFNYYNYVIQNNKSLKYCEYVFCDRLRCILNSKENWRFVAYNLIVSFANNGMPFQENFDKLINDIDVFLASKDEYKVITNEQDPEKYGIDNENKLVRFNFAKNIDYFMNVLSYMSKK